MSVMRGEEASGMKLPDVAVFAPCLSARPLLSCHWSIVALFVCRCSARLSLVHCWSARVGVAVLSLSCRCPVAVLSLSCRWSTAGLSARVRGRSSISSVAGLSARVGVADASLMCRWSVSALSLFCRYSARVMVAVTGLSLVHRCHWSVAGSSLLCHWSVAGSSLLCSGHSRWSWSLIVRHSCATALPVPLSAGLSLLSLTCLLEPWSLIRRLSAARLPLVHLIVHRYSSARCSVCLSITGPSLLRLLARRLSVCWPVACLSAGPSLLVRRFPVCLSVCSSVTYPWLVMVARASARSSRVALPLLRLLVHHWPVCSSVAFLSAVRSPVCLLEPWSLARRSSICCPSLLRLLES